MTESDKYKVWIDYMVTTVALNHTIHEFPINTKGVGEAKEYPVLGVKTVQNKRKHYIKSFEEFCIGDDERVSECLVGWYWRFKDRIND